MRDLNQLTPEQYRTRYESLQAAARSRAISRPALATFSDIPRDAISFEDSIPPGLYVALRVKRGQALRVGNPEGTPGAAMFLWNADDVSERYNAGDTLKVQWTTNLTAGRLLLSDMGRVLAAITADSGAGHDSILGTTTPTQTGGARNGRDNLRLAAAKFGLTRRDLGPCLSLFSKLVADEDGRLRFVETQASGAMIELRAEMNLLIALSNTPHCLSPAAESVGPIDVTVFNGPPAAADDFCRHASGEAKRAYTNTDRLMMR